LSGSALGGLLECPLRWFLSREAAGEAPRSSSMGFGNVLHVLADHLVKVAGATREELVELLDSVWDGLTFDSPWIAARERVEAEAAIDRLLTWHRVRPEREVVSTELDFDVTVPLEGAEVVQLRGRVDRLERDVDGALHVVDLKTTKNPPSGTSLAEHPQLGCYQLATDRQAFAGVGRGESRSGGAELVQLRIDCGGLPKVQEQAPQQPDESGRKPVEIQLTRAAETVRSEAFAAMVGDQCRLCEFASMCPAQIRSGTVLS
jgi:RecB family exonuclease